MAISPGCRAGTDFCNYDHAFGSHGKFRPHALALQPSSHRENGKSEDWKSCQGGSGFPPNVITKGVKIQAGVSNVSTVCVCVHVCMRVNQLPLLKDPLRTKFTPAEEQEADFPLGDTSFPLIETQLNYANWPHYQKPLPRSSTLMILTTWIVFQTFT